MGAAKARVLKQDSAPRSCPSVSLLMADCASLLSNQGAPGASEAGRASNEVPSIYKGPFGWWRCLAALDRRPRQGWIAGLLYLKFLDELVPLKEGDAFLANAGPPAHEPRPASRGLSADDRLAADEEGRR